MILSILHSNIFRLSCESVSSVLYETESDSDKVSDVLQDDLERGSALIAAFVVTLITITFFTVMIVMLVFTLSVSGDYQERETL